MDETTAVVPGDRLAARWWLPMDGLNDPARQVELTAAARIIEFAGPCAEDILKKVHVIPARLEIIDRHMPAQ